MRLASRAVSLPAACADRCDRRFTLTRVCSGGCAESTCAGGHLRGGNRNGIISCDAALNAALGVSHGCASHEVGVSESAVL